MKPRRAILRFFAASFPTLVCVFAGGGIVQAAEFIRGDANADGVVSMADALTVLQHLFHYGELQCPDAADANDDESLDIVDYVILNNRLLDGAALPQPFPAMGSDPTAGRETDSLDCPSYGGGSVLEDPDAALEVIDTVVDPAANGRAYLRFAVTSGVALAGISGKVRFEAGRVSSADKGTVLVEGFG